MQVQYRNCSYTGVFNTQQHKRDGFGLLIQDNSNIIMARWKQDIINGPYVMITERMRVLGTMINNKLEGYNIISIQESMISNKKEKERTVYGMFRDNKLYGKGLVIDNQQLITAYYTNGELREIIDRKPAGEKEAYELLSELFPNERYAISEWLIQIFSEAEREYVSDQNAKYKPLFREYQSELHFYGFNEILNKSKGIGFILYRGEVLSVGEHQNDLLHGFGRAYNSNGSVEDGVFKEGELDGIGIKYNKVDHKYTLGEYNKQNEAVVKGFGFPQKQISEIRKQFHLRSINFENDIVLFHFATIFEMVCSNSLQYNLEKQSPRFSNDNSEYIRTEDRKVGGISATSRLHAKILEYEIESNEIQQQNILDKHYINQYEKTDLRKNKYFQSRKLGNNKKQKRMQQWQYDNKSNKKNRSKSQIDVIKSLKYSNSINKRKLSTGRIRNTRQLVKQLDQKQKYKRSGYLDQIYKEAKLYNRKN